MGKGLQLPLRKQGVYTVSLVPEIFLGLHTYPTHEVANLSTEQAGNLQSSPREKQPDSVKDLLPRCCSSPAFHYWFLGFLVTDTYWFACWSQCLLHCGQGNLHQCLLEYLLADGAAVVVILLPKHTRKKQAHTCLGLFTTPTGNWFLSACCITGAQGFEWPCRLVQLLQNHSEIYCSGISFPSFNS